MTDRFARPPEESEAAQESAFADLFSAIVKSAKTENTPANIPVKWGFEMKRGEVVTQYDVLVNPVFLDQSGNPEFVTIDIDSKGVHLQQCVVSAYWENNRPQIMRFESALLEPSITPFPPTTIASIAKQAVKFSYSAEGIEQDMRLNPPPGSTDRLN